LNASRACKKFWFNFGNRPEKSLTGFQFTLSFATQILGRGMIGAMMSADLAITKTGDEPRCSN
jgi:hypothetical protein